MFMLAVTILYRNSLKAGTNKPHLYTLDVETTIVQARHEKLG